MSGKHRKQSSQSLIEIRLNEAVVNKSCAKVREIIEQGGLGLLAAKVILVNIFELYREKTALVYIYRNPKTNTLVKALRSIFSLNMLKRKRASARQFF